LVGLDEPDDSAVYKLNDTTAIVSTMDFFPPVVDDPYAFGAIAAANALSDVYAMGGEPFMAINLVAFPDGLDHSILTEILRGGAEKALEAGVVISGGHTVADKEPKYGLSVTGRVDPSKILTKGGARVGDKLILTKALGTGVITTALKNQQAEADHVQAAVDSMGMLNKSASEIATSAGVHAMTDITGFGLLGHALEMARAGQVMFRIIASELSWLSGALQYAQQGIFPGGMNRNRAYFDQWVTLSTGLEDYIQNLLYDPQTSGGLLMAVDADSADDVLATLLNNGSVMSRIIGEVHSGVGTIEVVP